MSKKKNMRKIPRPTDRTGAPIHIGDVLQWDDGTRMQVSTLTYYGKDFEFMGRWSAGDDNDEYADNLIGSLIVWSKR